MGGGLFSVLRHVATAPPALWPTPRRTSTCGAFLRFAVHQTPSSRSTGGSVSMSGTGSTPSPQGARSVPRRQDADGQAHRRSLPRAHPGRPRRREVRAAHREHSTDCERRRGRSPPDGETGRWNRGAAYRQSSFPLRGGLHPVSRRVCAFRHKNARSGRESGLKGAGRRTARSCGTTATAPSTSRPALFTVSHRTKATMPPTA